MGSFRQDKINEETSREITEILRTVKDPRISQAFVSITGCEVTKDLSYAKVYYSVLGKDEGVNKGLASAAGYIRKELAARLNLRITPKLVFIPDHSAENAVHISEMLKNIKYSEDNEECLESITNRLPNFFWKRIIFWWYATLAPTEIP